MILTFNLAMKRIYCRHKVKEALDLMNEKLEFSDVKCRVLWRKWCAYRNCLIKMNENPILCKSVRLKIPIDWSFSRGLCHIIMFSCFCIIEWLFRYHTIVKLNTWIYRYYTLKNHIFQIRYYDYFLTSLFPLFPLRNTFMLCSSGPKSFPSSAIFNWSNIYITMQNLTTTFVCVWTSLQFTNWYM